MHRISKQRVRGTNPLLWYAIRSTLWKTEVIGTVHPRVCEIRCSVVEAHMVRISVQASIGLHRGSSFILFPRMENDFNRFAAFCQLNAFVYLIQRKDMSDKFLCWE